MKKVNLFLVLIQIIVILSFWRKLPPQIPLFYSRPWGDGQLITTTGIFLIPMLSLLVFFFNLAFLSAFSTKDNLISRMLTAGSLVFSFLCLITLIRIIGLII